MLHLIYILAFTLVAFFAVSNLIRSLITLSYDSQRRYPNASNTGKSSVKRVPHPELLDNDGTPINEPLLVMKAFNLEDARQHLDALYEASPSPKSEDTEA